MNAVILAAGFGRRLLPLTADTPKALLKVKGKNLIDYHIEKLSDANLNKIVINTHYLSDQIERHVREKYKKLDILFSREDELLGTGGGLKKASELLNDEPILVVNADNFIESDYKEFVKDISPKLFVTEDKNGDFSVENGIVRVNEKKDFRFVGVSIILKREISDVELTKFHYWRDYLKIKASTEELHAEIINFNCYDVGTLELFKKINNE